MMLFLGNNSNEPMLSRYLLFLIFLCLVSPIQPALASNPQTPLLTEKSVYLSSQGIHKFNRDSLQQEWSSLAGIETFEPVMGKNFIFTGSTQGLYALNPDTGEIVWHIEKL